MSLLNGHPTKEDTLLEKISRKDGDKIFSDKDSYNSFVLKQKITKGITWVLILGLFLTLGMYGVSMWVYQSHNNSTEAYFSEMSFQNQIIGMLAMEESFVQHYRQHS